MVREICWAAGGPNDEEDTTKRPQKSSRTMPRTRAGTQFLEKKSFPGKTNLLGSRGGGGEKNKKKPPKRTNKRKKKKKNLT